jgi:hypothetical protein
MSDDREEGAHRFSKGERKARRRDLVDRALRERYDELLLPSILDIPDASDPRGYWKSERGGVFRIGVAVDGTVDVTGFAICQLVKGKGSIDGNRVAIRMTLLTEKIELTLELRTENHQLAGTARDSRGRIDEVRFERITPNFSDVFDFRLLNRRESWMWLFYCEEGRYFLRSRDIAPHK